MRILRWTLLAISIGLVCCQDPAPQAEQAAQQPETDSVVVQLIERFPTVLLPYHWNELALQHTDYKSMVSLDAKEAKQVFSKADTTKQHYAVARVFDTLPYMGIVILESYVDTLLHISDHYYLLTFDSLGQPVDQIRLASNVLGEQHYRLTGHIFTDGSITTEKFTYTFADGQWVRSAHAIKSVYYQLQSNGTIKEVHSEVDLDENEGDNNQVSELLPFPSSTTQL